LQTETRANQATIDLAREIEAKARRERFQLEYIIDGCVALQAAVTEARKKSDPYRRSSLEAAQRAARDLEVDVHDSDTPEGYDAYAAWASQLVTDLQGEIDAA